MYTIDVNQEYESGLQQKLTVVFMYRSCLVSNILIIIYIFVIKNKYTFRLQQKSIVFYLLFLATLITTNCQHHRPSTPT